MKSVLMSIQPKWCELIASGKKTVEVRKTRPKFETPFKGYIYCTKNGKDIYGNSTTYITDSSKLLNKEAAQGFEETSGLHKWNGKVIGEFVCDKIVIDDLYATEECGEYWGETTCLTQKQLIQYGDYKRLYFWHISELKFYDRPRALSEFESFYVCHQKEPNQNCYKCDYYEVINGAVGCTCFGYKPIERPPQSWRYVLESD